MEDYFALDSLPSTFALCPVKLNDDLRPVAQVKAKTKAKSEARLFVHVRLGVSLISRSLPLWESFTRIVTRFLRFCQPNVKNKTCLSSITRLLRLRIVKQSSRH